MSNRCISRARWASPFVYSKLLWVVMVHSIRFGWELIWHRNAKQEAPHAFTNGFKGGEADWELMRCHDLELSSSSFRPLDVHVLLLSWYTEVPYDAERRGCEGSIANVTVERIHGCALPSCDFFCWAMNPAIRFQILPRLFAFPGPSWWPSDFIALKIKGIAFW